MADTYEQISMTMEHNITQVQGYVKGLMNNKGKRIMDKETKLNIEKF